MIHQTQSQEEQYLDRVKAKLDAALEILNAHVRRFAKEIREQKVYLWENKAGMDHVEKISVRQSVTNAVLTAEAAEAKRKRLERLRDSPYFGRFDFVENSGQNEIPVYIGAHDFSDENQNLPVIHDWRAPISTMFYDFETGDAHYQTPSGKISGEIVLKRQYRIRKGVMEFMLESSIHIHDEILQRELSAASDERMKNIVATIQREQNAIIRNEGSSILIIQGVAGSGKTSIALHRIAFLLYRFKETLKSKDILIISPNRVFASYISNVLPELGEEMIPEMGIETLAEELLEYKFSFQTFAEQVSLLLEKNDAAFQRRIKTKASASFLEQLNQYIVYVTRNIFTAVDLAVRHCHVPARFIGERFNSHRSIPLFKRLHSVASDIESHIEVQYNYELAPNERASIKATLKKMFKIKSLQAAYRDFFRWMGTPELFKQAGRSKYEYSDVFPLIYLKIHLEGVKAYGHVQHLLVDEMQDYTVIQYAVLSRVFSGKKTLLGDMHQSVNPFSSSSPETIQRVFKDADCLKLRTSYRSTYNIAAFAQKILPQADFIPVKRPGEEPAIICAQTFQDEVAEIDRLIGDFEHSEHHSLGIICRTQKEAEELHRKIQPPKSPAHLLMPESVSYAGGITICSAHMAKGLEFDRVIVPHATPKNYATLMDKSILYIACTRAMHKLTITCVQSLTPLILAERPLTQ